MVQPHWPWDQGKAPWSKAPNCTPCISTGLDTDAEKPGGGQGFTHTCPSEELLGAPLGKDAREPGLALEVKNRVFIQCLHS